MKTVLAVGLALCATSPAAAGIIELTFTGIVQATPTDDIIVRQPGGGFAPYAGANAPTYPVTAGDSVTVTFRGIAPDVSGPQLPPGGVDGIYRFPLSGTNSGAPLGYIVSSINVGGLGSAQGTAGQRFGAGGFDLVYNSRTGEYAIDLGTDGSYGFGASAWRATATTPSTCSRRRAIAAATKRPAPPRARAEPSTR